MTAISEIAKKPMQDASAIERLLIWVWGSVSDEHVNNAAEELASLHKRIAELEVVKNIAQKIYDVSEQDGRYGDGAYALVLRDEYENSALLVKLGESLEVVNK